MRIALVSLCLLALSGCSNFLQSIYDSAASDNCSNQGASSQACQDSVDANSRSHSY